MRFDLLALFLAAVAAAAAVRELTLGWLRRRRPLEYTPGIVLVMISGSRRDGDEVRWVEGMLGELQAGRDVAGYRLTTPSGELDDLQQRLYTIACRPGREEVVEQSLLGGRSVLASTRGVFISREPVFHWESSQAPVVGAVVTVLDALTETIAWAAPSGVPAPGVEPLPVIVVLDVGIDAAVCAPIGRPVDARDWSRLPFHMGDPAGADANGHGTATLTAIRAAAPHNEIIWAAVPWELPTWTSQTAWFMQILAWVGHLAQNRAVVLNLSGSYGESSTPEFAGVVQEVFGAPVDQGVIVVAAAGNQESSSKQQPMAMPARLDDVVAVGTATEKGRRAANCRFGGKGSGPFFLVKGPTTITRRPKAAVEVRGYGHGGTSLATAVASGLIAASGVLRHETPPGDGAMVRKWAMERVAVVGTLARTDGLPSHNPLEQGLGLLHLL